MENLAIKIQELSVKYRLNVQKYREHLHKNPELSFNEKNTADYICSVLDGLNIKYSSNIGGYGIVAEIMGKGNGKTIALRADMDALPILEMNEHDFVSKNKGLMHACGHDFHVASLLGTALIINDLRSFFNGTVLLVFQPAEEMAPGGALAMINDNLFGNTKPDMLIAQHVYPDLPAGMVGFKKGQYMASSDEIYIKITGKGGHGALPHLLADPVLAASHIIVSLQQINSRENEASNPCVLTFGKVEAKGAVNVIPDEVFIEGTFRTMNEAWREIAHKRINEIACGIAQTHNTKCELIIKKGYPSLFNDNNVSDFAANCAKSYLGNKNVADLNIRMTAEDFAYFAQKYPSCMYRIGTGFNDGRINFPLHSAYFDINPDVYEIAPGLMSYICLSYLKV